MGFIEFSVRLLLISIFILCKMRRSVGLIDSADRDLTVFVVVPKQVELTVKAGESFIDAAEKFCSENEIDMSVF